MNRRRFLSALGLGMAGLYLRLAPRLEVPPTDLSLTAYWVQTTRVSTIHAESYQRALDDLLAGRRNTYLHAFGYLPKS